MTISTTTDRDRLAALGETLCERIGLPRYKLWFENKTRLAWNDGGLVVGVPNHFYQEWLEKKFAEDVRAVADTMLGRTTAVRFAIDPQLFQEARRHEAGNLGQEAGPAGEVLTEARLPHTFRPGDYSRPSAPTVPATEVRRWRQLSDFVVGPCNRVAHASALNLVENPPEGPYPLVLHGPVGTGKSHLLEGIYAGLRQSRPQSRIGFVTAEEFTNRFLQGMRQGKLASFRQHFRDCDALLLDDLHFLANKPATQEEFLHTLNALQNRERPVAITCDCHPRLADQFMPELTDRLLGGSVWGLCLPEEATRLELLRAKAGRGQPVIPEEVLAFLAGQLRGNVRELEGAIHNIRHYSRVAGRPIDLSLSREAVADLVRHSLQVVQVKDVERALCAVLALEPDALQSRKRGWLYSHPRMLAMYLARKHTGATYSEIGRYFGRNHSTTVAAEKKVRTWLREDASLSLGQRKIRARDVVERIEHEMAK